jgi:cytochrome P450
MTTAIAAKPAHVPADRVYDFDLYEVESIDGEYQLAMKKLNAPNVPEVFWTPRNGGHWVVTRSVEITRILNEYQTFSSRTIQAPKPVGRPPLKPLQVDPPEHIKYRNLLASALSPKAVTVLAETARTMTIDLIEGFKARGECEFIGEFAQHLPIAIFMKIVDLPEEDRIPLTSWSDAAMRGKTQEERDAGAMKVAAYGMQKVNERRANPGTDLISTIATAKIDGELLDDFTLTGMVTLLLFAGLDTVASMLGFFANFLARNPEHRHRLAADPSLIPNAVEEMLRRFPVATLGREVVQDTELGGAQLKVGDIVVLPTALDGLDERRFEHPEQVDYARKVSQHATFGGGQHRCMGSMLARTELRIFLEEWLQRIPDFELKPGAEIAVAARTVATITSLPLVWKVQHKQAAA